MKRLLIIGPYPDIKDTKDGKLQRIFNVDKILSEFGARTYLDLKYRRISTITFISNENKIIQIDHFNIFGNIIKILNILKSSDIILINALDAIIKILPFIIFKRRNRRKFIFDLHGAVPEEIEFYGRNILSKLYQIIERIAFFKCSSFIYVTESMRDFYFLKYPGVLKKENIILPIFNFQYLNHEEHFQVSNSFINDNDVVFIYSGNIQKWQKIDLMLDIIESIVDTVNYKFLILTGEKKKMIALLIERNLHLKQNILVDSVNQDSLFQYYSMAHYGFILRDNHILNHVACPTKLIEYLSFGIVPIVMYDDIGDFKKFNYENVHYKNVNQNLTKIKSEININVTNKMQHQVKEGITNLHSLIN